MTGGTSGFGRRAVERLLRTRAQWRIILLARDRQRAVDLSAHARGRVRIVPADLSSLESIDRACDEVVSLLGRDRFHALSLNAGIQGVGADAVSQDGYELTFAVNHLAHYAVACRLMPHMQPRGRVVITASEVHDPDAFCLMGIARSASDLAWLLTEADIFDRGGAYINGTREEPGSAESRDASKITRMRAVSDRLIAEARAQRQGTRPLRRA